MPFRIVRNDITKMHVDVIVNTANSKPIYSSGTDTAVYKAAGEELLLAERQKIGVLEQGDVAITPGFHLPAKYIIHAVSPFYINGESGEEELLRACYRKSLALAYDKRCKSIAFPLIATGSFGYPKEEGMRIAVDEINAFLLKHEMFIYLVVFDADSTRLGRNLYPELEAYIDHNYVVAKREEEYGWGSLGAVARSALSIAPSSIEKQRAGRFAVRNENIFEECSASHSSPIKAPVEADDVQTTGKGIDEDFWITSESALKERMQHMSDTFQEYLLYLIETKGRHFIVQYHY